MCGLRTFRAGEASKACVPDSERNCQQSVACKRQGLCHLDSALHPERCVAKTAADCLAADDCAQFGLCALSEHASCVASAAGCSRSAIMRAQGRTTPTLPAQLGPQRPISHDDTGKRSETTCQPGPPGCAAACREEGACTEKNGECLANSNEDCRKSALCIRNGRCSLDETSHTCVARVATDCAKADVCLRGGKDETSSVDTRVCQARPGVDACTADFCQRFEFCALRGDCHAESGICMPTEPKDCAESFPCKIYGRCTFSGNNCFVTNQADCQASYECKAFGRCVYVPPRIGKGGNCINPSEGVQYQKCTDHDCWTNDKCLITPQKTCVTPESVGLPRLSPPNPTPRLEMEAQVDGRAVPLLYAIALAKTPNYGVAEVDVRLSEKALGCTEFSKPSGTAHIALAAMVGVRSKGYVKYTNHVSSASFLPGRGGGGVPPVTVHRVAARLEGDGLGVEPTVLDLDLDAHADDGHTMAIHGALRATPCTR